MSVERPISLKDKGIHGESKILYKKLKEHFPS